MEDLLDYFISERKGVVVVSFVGRLEPRSLPVLTQIMDELNHRDARMIIFNCHDLSEIDHRAMRPLSELQRLVREKPAALRFCFLSPAVRSLLLQASAVQEAEITDNILQAVESMSGEHSQLAADLDSRPKAA